MRSLQFSMNSASPVSCCLRAWHKLTRPKHCQELIVNLCEQSPDGGVPVTGPVIQAPAFRQGRAQKTAAPSYRYSRLQPIIRGLYSMKSTWFSHLQARGCSTPRRSHSLCPPLHCLHVSTHLSFSSSFCLLLMSMLHTKIVSQRRVCLNSSDRNIGHIEEFSQQE